jgi:nuclear pore complex protein Nup155
MRLVNSHVQLFNEFAEPLNMLEIMLLIFYVSDHHDAELIADTWNAIFARGTSAAISLTVSR